MASLEVTRRTGYHANCRRGNVFSDPRGTGLEEQRKALRFAVKSAPSKGLFDILSDLDTLPQIHMEARKGPCTEDSSLVKGPSPLQC